MIQMVRVDHRLIHGQMTFSWIVGVQANCILVASDQVSADEVWKTTLRLAKPASCKLVIKNIQDSIAAINSGVTDQYKLIVLVQSIPEAKELLDGCPQIRSLNIGNTRETSQTHTIAGKIYVTDEDKKQLKDLIDRGVEVEIRSIASDKKLMAQDYIK